MLSLSSGAREDRRSHHRSTERTRRHLRASLHRRRTEAGPGGVLQGGKVCSEREESAGVVWMDLGCETPSPGSTRDEHHRLLQSGLGRFSRAPPVWRVFRSPSRDPVNGSSAQSPCQWLVTPFERRASWASCGSTSCPNNLPCSQTTWQSDHLASGYPLTKKRGRLVKATRTNCSMVAIQDHLKRLERA